MLVDRSRKWKSTRSPAWHRLTTLDNAFKRGIDQKGEKASNQNGFDLPALGAASSAGCFWRNSNIDSFLTGCFGTRTFLGEYSPNLE